MLRWVSSFLTTPWALLIPCAITLMVYWPGLSGPLMLDDAGSLSPVIDWLERKSSAFEVLLGNISGPTGRPLAMASFLLNAAVGGDSVWSLKLGNLLLHLLTGLAVWAVSKRILRASGVGVHSEAWALVITAVWLLHPLQLSTVLYVVQRMTQLAALFSLLALWAWLRARECFDQHKLREARLWLWLAVPAFSALALLGKENGVLAPLLCVALELALYGWRSPRHRDLRWMIALILIGTCVALIAVLASGYGSALLAAYGIRDYTPYERVMTQVRVLWHYVGQTFWPDVQVLGLYHDAFPPSRGWLQPVSTGVGLAAWILIVGIALALRRRLPLFAAGIALFLVGHSLEASPLNLELYFEHRSYLPLLGLLLAFTGLVLPLIGRQKRSPIFAPALVTCLVLLFASQTAGKAQTWSSPGRITEEALRAHPESIRAHVDFAIYSVERGRSEDAERILSQLAIKSRPEARKVGLLFLLGTSCYLRGDAEPDVLMRLHALADGSISLFQSSAFEMVADKLVAGPCGRVTAGEVAELALAHVRAMPRPEQAHISWRLRRTAGKLLLIAGDPDAAQQALAPVWHARIADGESVFLYARALHQNGKTEESVRVCEAALTGMQRMDASWREAILLALREMRR